MNSITEDAKHEHVTMRDLRQVSEKDFLNLLSADTKKHLNHCQRCREFVDILKEAKQIAGRTKPDTSVSHSSRLILSETISQIYEQSLSPKQAANFLSHVQSCSQCFAHVALVLEESLSPLPENMEEELAGYANISIAEQALKLAPPMPSKQSGALIIIWGKSKQSIQGIFDSFRLKPTWGFAFVALVIIVFVAGLAPFKEWRAQVHTRGAMVLLQNSWTITADDLRPPGNFPRSIFTITHSAEPSPQTEPIVTEFEKALKWDKNNRAAIRGLAIYWYFYGNSVRADSILLTLLAEDSLDFESWNILGLVAAREGDSIKALTAFDKTLKIQPDFAEAAFNRALVLQQLGRLEEAKKAWKYYLDIDTQSDWASVARRRLLQIPAE
jgi:hypothetical protein